MSKETIKVVEINTDPAKKSIKDLRKELLELKNQMANLEEGGDEFLEIANKAGELKHQLDEINESVKVLLLILVIWLVISPMLQQV